MGSLIIYEFEDVDSSLDKNMSYLYYEINFGEGGEHEVAVCTDIIADSGCISTNTESVTVSTSVISRMIVEQEELDSLLGELVDATSIDTVFDALVALQPECEYG